MIKYVQCRRCFGKNGKVASPGYISEMKLAKDGKTQVEVLTECECHIKWRNACKIEGRAKKAHLNMKWVDFDPEKEYVGERSIFNRNRLISYTKQSLDPNTPEEKRNKLKSCVIYVYGPNGTQKTTLANYVGFQFLKANKTVYYCLMNDLIKLLQKADRDENTQELLDRISDVDLLIIDEAFDSKKVTIYKSDWQIPFLDTFLRNRIQTKNKGILFVSNVDIDEIAENKFSPSIQDLVNRNVALCNGKLYFEDNYVSSLSKVDVEELF